MIQRPRNRQGRPESHRNGRRHHGPHEGRQDKPTCPPSVPNAQQVVTGKRVSVVLKEDQPTGREVQGLVADVLTRGNHPRGIKVRLVDGRVGRVQRIVTEEGPRTQSEHNRDFGRYGQNGNHQSIGDSPGVPEGPYREMDKPTSTYSLGDLLPAGRLQRHSTERAAVTQLAPPVTEQASQVCPVCGQFEGDEFAVSHHVSSHFD